MYTHFSLLISLLALSSSALADTYLRCERLLTGVDDESHLNKTIHVQESRIVAVLEDYTPAVNDKVIEIAGTCMPGLIDMHVHITSELNPKRYIDRFRLDSQDAAYASVPYAKETLMAGFTTVRDLGCGDNLCISLRNAINRGQIDGPRIFTAGKSLATTGGHADPSNGVNQKLRGDPGPKDGVVNSIGDIKKAVRQRYKDGADLIKITATGGVLSQAKSGQNPQFTDEELQAIVSIARDYGFKVAAHAHGNEGMQRAVRAGVDSIEHGTYMDDATMRLMKRNGTAYVPTIMAGMFVAEKAKEDGYFSELVRPKAATIGPLISDTFTRAYTSGVWIVFGTDTGVSAHGDNWQEFVFMVEGGMPAIEAIHSATREAARLLGEDDLGTIESGKLADIVAVTGDPLDDISTMQNVQFVMKNGKVYREP